MTDSRPARDAERSTAAYRAEKWRLSADSLHRMCERGASLARIGQAAGVTRERVRQVLRDHFPALDAMRAKAARSIDVVTKRRREAAAFVRWAASGDGARTVAAALELRRNAKHLSMSWSRCGDNWHVGLDGKRVHIVRPAAPSLIGYARHQRPAYRVSLSVEGRYYFAALPDGRRALYLHTEPRRRWAWFYADDRGGRSQNIDPVMEWGCRS